MPLDSVSYPTDKKMSSTNSNNFRHSHHESYYYSSSAKQKTIDHNLQKEGSRAARTAKDYFEGIALSDLEVPEIADDGIDPAKIEMFNVGQPMKMGGHVKYKVVGVDGMRNFEEMRRYKEFFTLRNTLVQRWPGVYIPMIPEKKLIGNKDSKFLDERRNLLERFLKELACKHYLVESNEFKIFAREKNDVVKVLGFMIKQTPEQILEKYRIHFTVSENQDSAAIAKYQENIS